MGSPATMTQASSRSHRTSLPTMASLSEERLPWGCGRPRTARGTATRVAPRSLGWPWRTAASKEASRSEPRPATPSPVAADAGGGVAAAAAAPGSDADAGMLGSHGHGRRAAEGSPCAESSSMASASEKCAEARPRAQSDDLWGSDYHFTNYTLGKALEMLNKYLARGMNFKGSS